MLGCHTMWSISSEEYNQRSKQFESLIPNNGFITGLQAKEYFTQSKLPTKTLCQIWNLADYDKDGKMNFHEFSIAMHLIKRSLEGVSLPDTLPKEMMVPPNNFTFPDPNVESQLPPPPPFPGKQDIPPPLPKRSSTVFPSSSPVVGWDEEWAVLAAVRPRYKLQFNQQDRYKSGFLSGEDAKQVLLRSGLPRAVLARIWQLSDVDCDGKLSCDEFCVAMYLIEQARAGRALPKVLPDSLVPPSMVGKTKQPVQEVHKQHSQPATQTVYHQDPCVGSPSSISRFSDSRPATLRVAPDSPHVPGTMGGGEHVDPESTIFSQMSPKPCNSSNNTNHNNQFFPRYRPAPSASSSSSVTNSSPYTGNLHPAAPPPDFRYSMREGDKKLGTVGSAAKQLQSIVDERNREKELLMKLKERQEFLIATLAAEEEKCLQFQERLCESRRNVEDQKNEIEQMRDERDKIIEGTSCLQEEIEAAKAEEGRCKRDREKLEREQQESQMKLNGDEESISNKENGEVKQVQMERQIRQKSIESLQTEIQELEATISMKSLSTQNSNCQLRQLQACVEKEKIPEIERLKHDVAVRRNEVHKLIIDRNGADSTGENDRENEKDTEIESGVNESRHTVSNQSFDTPDFISTSNQSRDQQPHQPTRVPESPPPPVMKTERYIAQHPFTGRQSDELTFKSGDIILVRVYAPQNTPTGWFYGRHESGGLFGLFPEVYVQKCEPEIKSPTDEDINTVKKQVSLLKDELNNKDDIGVILQSPDAADDDFSFNNTLPQGATIKKAPLCQPPSIFTWVEAIYPWMIEDGDADSSPLPTNNRSCYQNDENVDDSSYERSNHRNQLSFRIGQKIKVIEKSQDDDWWKGELTSTNDSGFQTIHTGWFPQIYVRNISKVKEGAEPTEEYNKPDSNPYGSGDNNDDEESCNTTKYSNLNFSASSNITNAVHYQASNSPNNNSTAASNDFCLVLYPYKSSVPGDLTVQPGDILRLLDESPSCGDYWWLGQQICMETISDKGANNDGDTGLFPANYARKITEEELQNAEALSTQTSTEYYTSITLDNNICNQSNLSTNQNSETSNNPQVQSIVYDDMAPEQSVSSQNPKQTTAVSLSSPQQSANEIEEPSDNNQTCSTYSNYCSLADQTDSEEHQETQFESASQSPSLQHQQSNNPLANAPVKGSQSSVRASSIPPDSVSINNSQHSTEESQNPMTASGYDQVAPTLTPSSSSNQTPSRFSDIKIGNFLLALYPYSAQNPDELSFSKSDLIRVISKDEPDWWKGCNESLPGRTFGLFPVNYIRKLEPDKHAGDAELYNNLPSIAISNSNEVMGDGADYGQHTDQMVYSTVTGRPISWYIDGQVNFNALLTEDEKRRQFYIIELIETEKAYYDDLQEVHRVFYEPIKKAGILPSEDLRHIFLNWTDLIAKSYNFFMALKIRQDKAGFRQPVQCIGDILLSNFPNFIVYVRFCSMQNHAIMRLEKRKQQIPNFRELCDQCELNLRCQKMPMSSYFLKPMQRITKYKLLVENILKHTDEEHPDRGDMEEAVAAGRSLCEAVNEGIREKENSERLEWIQEHIKGAYLHGSNTSEDPQPICFNSTTNSLGHRKLIYSGTLFKTKSGKELVGFLFNDFMMLTTPQYNTGGCPFVFPLETSSTSKMQFKMYKKPILLNRVLIMTGIPSTQNSLSVTAATSSFAANCANNNEIFTIREAGTDHVLKALSVNDRDKWVERLVAASLQYIEIENSVREISMSIRRTAGVGRLIVTILEGINLRANSGSGEGKVNAYCEVSLGNQLRRTKVVTSTYNPKWHSNMQFLIKNLHLDILCLSVYDKDYFAPNEYLGRTEISVKEIKNQKISSSNSKGPIEKKLKLIGVPSGEILVRFDIVQFRNDSTNH